MARRIARRRTSSGHCVGLVVMMLGCGASTGAPRAAPAGDADAVAPVAVGAMTDAYGIGSCEAPEAPEYDDDCWGPTPAATAIIGLIEVWAARVDAADSPEVLPTGLTGGLHDSYNLAADRLSLFALEGLMGAPVFSDGPHGRHPVLDDPERFGRYDTTFLDHGEVVLEWLERRDAITPERRAALQGNVVISIRTLLAIREEIDARGGMADLLRVWREAGSTFLPPGGDRDRANAWRDSTYAQREDDIYGAVWELLDEDPDPVVNNGVGFWVRRALGGNDERIRALLQRALCLIDDRYH